MGKIFLNSYSCVEKFYCVFSIVIKAGFCRSSDSQATTSPLGEAFGVRRRGCFGPRRSFRISRSVYTRRPPGLSSSSAYLVIHRGAPRPVERLLLMPQHRPPCEHPDLIGNVTVCEVSK